MLKRCDHCGILFNNADPIQANAHEHPEPHRGLFQEAFLKSKLSYARWIEETREGMLWARARGGPKPTINVPKTQEENGPITVAAHISELIIKHGSLNKVSKAIGISAGYLSRLYSRHKANPSDSMLKKLGLRKKTTVTYYREIPTRKSEAPADKSRDATVPVHYMSNLKLTENM